MKILFISDFSLHHSVGGAQRSNDIIFKEGLRRGHTITMLHIDMDYSNILNKEFDLVISSNMESFFTYKKEVFEYCCNARKHVRLEHDMCRYLDPESRKRLFNNCDISFFLTSHHINKFIESYGDIFKNVTIVPDPIDGSVFYNRNEPRKNRILYTGFMHKLKGTENFINFAIANPELMFTVAGWGPEVYENFMKSNYNIDFLGKVDYNDMPKVYNSHDAMFCYPEMDEPFCRSVGEAIACGIEKFICNDKIGSLNMAHEDKDFIFKCNKAHETFWEKCENV